MNDQPLMYNELAPWFHLITSPEEYEEDAAQAIALLTEAIGEPPSTILELGSGGGNNASHMKAQAELTLTDISQPMLDISMALNPGCEHVLGDMTTLRLDRHFDAVFVHDAVGYLTTEEALRAAIETAFVHTRPGGAALFAPDAVKEGFVPMTDHGGHDGVDGDRRSLRYLEWTWDPDPNDTTCITDYAYLLRTGDQTRVVHDRHIEGLFPRATWLAAFVDVGFDVELRASAWAESEPVGAELFLGRRPS